LKIKLTELVVGMVLRIKTPITLGMRALSKMKLTELVRDPEVVGTRVGTRVAITLGMSIEDETDRASAGDGLNNQNADNPEYESAIEDKADGASDGDGLNNQGPGDNEGQTPGTDPAEPEFVTNYRAGYEAGHADGANLEAAYGDSYDKARVDQKSYDRGYEHGWDVAELNRLKKAKASTSTGKAGPSQDNSEGSGNIHIRNFDQYL
jgi:hypothetical protein